MLSVRFGDIVLVSLVDMNGVNTKPRPAVVVSPNEVVSSGGPIVVVALTSTLPRVMTEDHVPLQWQHNKHPITGLNKPNAAVCNWLSVVQPDQIIRQIGRAVGDRLQAIAARCRENAQALIDSDTAEEEG